MSNTRQRNSLDDISAFLKHQRIAFVGVSKNPQDFTRRLMQEMVQRGYDVVPVNPGAESIEGRQCYSRVQDVEPRIDAALLMTAPAVTEQIVRDCADGGVDFIWMYRAGGAGSVNETAVAFCREHGMRVIAGECPFMFFPHTGLPHRIHGFLKRIAGTYPQ
ncbi:MAG TPA: CoA-binding protein [Terriglobales bacterium]|nr:CoA-binding protein [Terriglobales bacterium]